MLLRIDKNILCFCTKFAHWLQEMTGKTNFFIAKIGIFGTSISVMMDIANYLNQFFAIKTSFFGALISFIIWVGMFFDAVNLDKADKHAGVSEERVVLSPLTARTSPGRRILLIALSVFDTTLIFLNLNQKLNVVLFLVNMIFFAYGLAIFYYFSAVEPLRPGKSKIRKWLEGLLFNPEPVPVEAEN